MQETWLIFSVTLGSSYVLPPSFIRILGISANILQTPAMTTRKIRLLNSYLVGCCSISDLLGKGEKMLGEA